MTHTLELCPQMGCLCLRRIMDFLRCPRRQPLFLGLSPGVIGGPEGILPLLLQRLDRLHGERGWSAVGERSR